MRIPFAAIMLVAATMFSSVSASPFPRPTAETPQAKAVLDRLTAIRQKLNGYCSSYSNDTLIGLACTQANKALDTATGQVNAKGDNVVEHIGKTLDRAGTSFEIARANLEEKAAQLKGQLATLKATLAEREALAAEMARIYVKELGQDLTELLKDA